MRRFMSSTRVGSKRFFIVVGHFVFAAIADQLRWVASGSTRMISRFIDFLRFVDTLSNNQEPRRFDGRSKARPWKSCLREVIGWACTRIVDSSRISC